MAPPTKAPFDVAVDWLMEWALAQDQTVPAHFWHICEGDDADCGCPHEGAAFGQSGGGQSDG